MKTCTVCKTNKPLTEYYNLKASKDGKSYRYIPCDTIARNRYTNAYPERVKKALRERNWKYKYDMEPHKYDIMLSQQDSKCAICGSKHDKQSDYFAVDHNHSTGAVRGLLCNKCNRGLGFLNDDITTLKRAITYLETH